MQLALLEKIIHTYFAVVPRPKPSLELLQSARLIAHRGAHDKAQGVIENTLAAFILAEQLGCWGIELDVHATADKVLVVNHDPTLNRIWGHDLAIANLSFTDLRALVPNVPTLAEVVAEFGHHMHLLIELKSSFQDEEALVQVLHGLTAGEEYHLLTLNASIFHALSQFPKHSLLLVAYNNVQELCDLCIKENYGGVLGHYLLVTIKLVNQLKAAGRVAGVGFVDSRYSLYRELNRGVTWVFTNRAVEVSSYLK